MQSEFDVVDTLIPKFTLLEAIPQSIHNPVFCDLFRDFPQSEVDWHIHSPSFGCVWGHLQAHIQLKCVTLFGVLLSILLLLMMTVGILLRWQSWDRSIHTQFEFGRRLKHPSWYTFQSLQAVHRSVFYSIIYSLGWWYLLGSSTRYTQSMHDDDSLSVEFLNNPSPNLDEGGDDYPNPMMRVMTVLFLGLVQSSSFATWRRSPNA